VQYTCVEHLIHWGLTLFAAAPTKKQSIDRVLDHLIGHDGVLFGKLGMNGLEARWALERCWPTDHYHRYWRHTVFRTETEVLSRLHHREPLNRYQLAELKPKMHYNAIRRATNSLLRRKAIEVESRRPWRTGKVSTKYRVTPFGRFLLLLGRARNTSHIYQCLLRLANESGYKLLEELANCVMNISDQDRRHRHLDELLDIVLEAQASVSRTSWQLPITAEFISRVWWDSEDIAAYGGHVPYECRFLLTKTKEELLAAAQEIDRALTSRRVH